MNLRPLALLSLLLLFAAAACQRAQETPEPSPTAARQLVTASATASVAAPPRLQSSIQTATPARTERSAGMDLSGEAVITRTPGPADSDIETASAPEEITPTGAAVTRTETAVPSATPQPASPDQEQPPAEGTLDANCTNLAAFEGDITVPDDTRFRQGEGFVKTWRIYNAGTCTWSAGYALVFDSGDPMGAASPYLLPEPVPPGTSTDISLDFTAPTGGGVRYGNWKFADASGSVFGVGHLGRNTIWVRIVVNWIEPTPGPQSSGTDACLSERNPEYTGTLLQLLNAAREAAGLQTLRLDASLSQAADAHSEDMACRDFVDHTGSDGSNWYGRISAQGYSYSRATENIYVGNPEFGGTPQGAFNWWMSSQVHHDNIMDPQVSEVGIGYVYSADSTYRGYYTLVFASP